MTAAAGGPAVRVGRRFLPVAAATLPPLGTGGEVGLTVPAGTPVHAVASGRVLAAESSAVGEVVLRIDDEVRLAYRRLAPSSVSVRRGDSVTAGDHLGVVARDAGNGVATLELAASRGDGLPVEVAELLVGAADPLELFLAPPPGSRSVPPRPAAGTAPWTRRRPERAAPSGPTRPRPPTPDATRPAAAPAARGLTRRRARSAPEPAPEPTTSTPATGPAPTLDPPDTTGPPTPADTDPPPPTEPTDPASTDHPPASEPVESATPATSESDADADASASGEPSAAPTPATTEAGDPSGDAATGGGEAADSASRASRLAGRRRRPGRSAPS